jgi:hypothetical protein
MSVVFSGGLFETVGTAPRNTIPDASALPFSLKNADLIWN